MTMHGYVDPAAPVPPLPRQAIVPVVEQTRLARDTYRLRLESPELAAAVIPGQFFMVRAPGTTDPLLGRPFALYDTWLDATGRPAGIDIVHLVVGKMTGLISSWRAGDCAEVWGPLGNGFPAPTARRLLVVAGGIGNTPFLAVVREALGLRSYGVRGPAPFSGGGYGEKASRGAARYADAITFCYGARSAEYLAGLEDFDALGIDVRVATDDGTRGHHGYVTDLAERWLDEHSRSATSDVTPSSSIDALAPVAEVFCCGPEPMMRAVARLATEHSVPCWLSLETPMACGFGACFSCVTRVRQPDGGWDYRRVCVEGPVFPAEQLAL